MNIQENIEEAAKKVNKADAVLITAGAGMGVDSGLPDFRGNEGFWKAYPPIAKLGISFVEMANPQWFEIKPYLAWAFYGHRLNLYRKTVPHEGFSQLLEIAEKKPADYFVFTSNVDGQFQKAGFSDERVEECHGSIHHLQCTAVCSSAIWSAEDLNVSVAEDKFEAQDPLPKCIHCGELARPNILMFGDWMWISNRSDYQAQAFSKWLKPVRENKLKLVIIEAGAGRAVPTVRMKSEYAADVYNGTLIRINPRDYDVPPGNISIPMGAGDGIREIYERVKR